MREIKFRAKRTDTGEWVFGGYVHINFHDSHDYQEQHQIVIENGHCFEIDISTLGQYTGRKDKTGKEIYEGDIVIELYQGKAKYSYPEYREIHFDFHSDHSSYMYQLGWNLWEEEEIQIIGKIYENGDLLNDKINCE